MFDKMYSCGIIAAYSSRKNNNLTAGANMKKIISILLIVFLTHGLYAGKKRSQGEISFGSEEVPATNEMSEFVKELRKKVKSGELTQEEAKEKMREKIAEIKKKRKKKGSKSSASEE